MRSQPYCETFRGTQDLLTLAEASPSHYPFLLESTAYGSHGRYDILFAFPQGELLQTADELPCTPPDKSVRNFLQAFDVEFALAKQTYTEPQPIPFHGGWFVFLAYEVVALIESCLQLPAPDHRLPLAYACRIPAAIICDHELNQTTLLAESGFENCIGQMRTDLQQVQEKAVFPRLSLSSIAEDDPATFLQGVQRIKQYIRDGDVFQVNLSRQWSASLPDEIRDCDIYRCLRKANPAPFSGLARLPGASIISSSPERLVAVRNGEIVTRPIAGTRRRGDSSLEDADLQKELLAHPKERSEHIMLIDLERNDLGRVCKPGTVRVDELLGVESYAHVHHIVSNVRGELRSDMTPGDIIRAVFPGGTITGCPKVRCMEIIAELEGMPRGAYTGSMGYINRDGSMDLNILIRTMVQSGRALTWRAGAGIVADSSAPHELEETRAKAKGLVAAVQ